MMGWSPHRKQLHDDATDFAAIDGYITKRHQRGRSALRLSYSLISKNTRGRLVDDVTSLLAAASASTNLVSSADMLPCMLQMLSIAGKVVLKLFGFLFGQYSSSQRDRGHVKLRRGHNAGWLQRHGLLLALYATHLVVRLCRASQCER